MLTILTIFAVQFAFGAKVSQSMNFLDVVNSLADSMGIDVESDQLAYDFSMPETSSSEDTDDSWPFDQDALDDKIAEATEAAEDYYEEIAAAAEEAQDAAEEAAKDAQEAAEE